MDKFVTVVKPSARTLAGESAGGKQDKQKQRVPYRYSPYSDAKANERQPGDLKEKRRVEKCAILTENTEPHGTHASSGPLVCSRPSSRTE